MINVWFVHDLERRDEKGFDVFQRVDTCVRQVQRPLNCETPLEVGYLIPSTCYLRGLKSRATKDVPRSLKGRLNSRSRRPRV